jgi:hypothetical protein
MGSAMAQDGFEKQDRMGRLLHELLLLQASRRGLTTLEIGERMGITRRTAQRDLRALEEIGVPLLVDGAHWRLVEGYFLPPVKFSLQEAVGLLLAARLMLRYADLQNRYTAMAYEKLAAVLPASVRQPVLETAAALTEMAEDVTYTKVLAALTRPMPGRSGRRRIRSTLSCASRPRWRSGCAKRAGILVRGCNSLSTAVVMRLRVASTTEI